MGTIVEHIESKKRFILLGTGFGMHKSKTPGALWGNWAPDTEEGSEKLLCVTEANGEIHWIRAEEARVISIGGKALDELL